MAAKTPHGLHRGSHNFSSALSSALLEWLLMLLLFLDGLFSYMVTKFARSCGLQTPCLICSRLDHVLGNEKPGFYKDLICVSHKSEISSLAYCHVLQKLPNVSDMCEGCVLSFATEKKSNAETNRFLVGKLGVDIGDSDNAFSRSPATVDSDDQNNRFYGEDATNVPLLNKDPVPKHCSCCSKPFKKKSHAISLLQSEPIGVDVAETGISLSCLTGQNYLSLHNGANMTTDEPLVSSTIKYSGNNDFGPLSHIGYSELQVTSDSESDVPLSDDENGNTSVHGTRDFKEEFTNRCLQPDTFIIVPNSSSATLSDDQIQEKLIHIDPTLLKTSPSILEKQIDDCGSQDIPNMDSTTSTGHGLEELNRHRVEVRTDPSVLSEIITQLVPSEISNATLNALEVDDIASITNTSSGELSKGLSSTDCSKPFKKKSHAISLLQSEPIGVDVAETGISLSCLTGQNYLSLHNGANMTTDEPLVSSTIKYSGNNDFGPLSHIGYSELQVTSDSESDVPLSDDENGNTSVHGTRDFKEEFTNRCLQPDTFIIVPNSSSATLSDDQIQEKLIHIDPTLLKTSPSILEKQIDDRGSQDIPNMDSTTSTGHGLEELNRHRVEVRTDPSVLSEIIQLVPSEISNATLNALEVDDIASITNTSSGELSKGLSSTEMNMKTSQIMGYSGQSLQVPMDLNDTYKFVTGSKSSLTSSTSTEIITGRDTARVHGDLKSLISEISSTGGLESPWNDLIPSPRVNYQNDEFKFSDASSSAILQNITKRLSMERNESGLESLDGSMVSEIEGESITGRLKRQLELDRKSMNLLYKELEEERSASAIAANQAMAMITRLQEEKAAMQMEALQYQRMMEDQAEYDQEVIQNLNKLLSEREKEIQSLKVDVDVDSYRKWLRDDLLDDRKLQSFSYADAREQDPTSTLPFDFRLSDIHLKDSLLNFEDEKIYISHCLKNLERKLRLFLDDGISVDESRVNTIVGIPVKSCVDFVGGNYKQGDTMLEYTVRKSDHYSEEATVINDPGSPRGEDVPQEKSQTESCDDFVGENYKQEDTRLEHTVRKIDHYYEEETVRNDLESPRGKAAAQEKSQTGDVLSEEKGPELGSNGHQKETSLCSVSVDDGQYTMVGRENDLDAFANDLSLLTERLEALEADRRFLEHTINQLKSGDDGIQFVQEIAYHLREIRRIGIRHR